MYLNIKNGAVFIADAHESSSTSDFYKFLQKVDNGKIKTPQLFLMGDMFDLLVGDIAYTVKKYQKYIDLIEKISLHVEVFYFEGNHDFRLKKLFKNVKVIPFEAQPLRAKLEDSTTVYLSHGDRFEKKLYQIYTKLIRNSMILKFLNLVDILFLNKVSNSIQEEQKRKNLCKKIENFEDIILSKLNKYSAKNGEFIVEGHYHQNYKFSQSGINYINLPPFVCNQSYFIVEYSQNDKFAHKK